MAEVTFDVDALLTSIDTWRREGTPLPDLFLAAGVQAVDDDELRRAVRTRLTDAPELIASWQGYSYDKRWTPSPYLDGLEVGHYDSGYRHVRKHQTTTDACADFVLTEVRWVVDHRVIGATQRVRGESSEPIGTYELVATPVGEPHDGQNFQCGQT